MVEFAARSPRGALVVGASLLWVIALLWSLQSGEGEAVSHPSAIEGAEPSAPLAGGPTLALADEPVSEIQLAAADPAAATGARSPSPAPSLDTLAPSEPLAPIEQAPATHPLWFESERALGVCKISYEGARKTANLHVATRVPAGKLSFAWQCGKERGRASIDVVPERTNGVLFCKESGGVRVKTVRSKDARCG